MDPEKVTSPKRSWRLREIVYNAGEWAVAKGQWESDGYWRDAIGIRWNGEEGEIGNPQSRGLPTWFVLPNELVKVVMGTVVEMSTGSSIMSGSQGMAMQENKEVNWLTVFRMDQGNDWLYEEIRQGRLRQGWGGRGLALTQSGGTQRSKQEWETAYREKACRENLEELPPRSRRYAILVRMLELSVGDIVVIPKMPEQDQFTIVRVCGKYRFESADDFGHIIPVDPESLRVFNYLADDDAFTVSGLFSRANHRAAVTFCESTEHAEAMLRLFKRENGQAAKSESELLQTPIDQAFKMAAMSLQDRIKTWDGHKFENAVRHAFREQGYQVKDGHRRYDRQGGDADIVVFPPAPSRFLSTGGNRDTSEMETGRRSERHRRNRADTQVGSVAGEQRCQVRNQFGVGIYRKGERV